MAGSAFTFFHAKVSKSTFLGLLWTFTCTSFLFVLFRVVVRYGSFKRLYLDDFFVLLAWAIMLTTAIIWQIEGQVLYEMYAISEGKQPYTPDILPKFGKFMRFVAPLTILFYSGLWCVKFSFLAFFYRLGSKVKSHRIWWYVVLFCTVAVWMASVADIDYRCSFGGLEYTMTQCSNLYHVHFENRTFWANCAGDVVTDLMILSIPVLILWKTRITFTKKLILLSVFSVTIIVMAIAIIRVVVNTSLDEPVDISWLYLWSFIEMGTAIIISCVASFRQLFVTSQNQHLFGKVAYHPPNNPLLNSMRNGYRRTQSGPGVEGDGSSQRSGTAPKILPLDLVHVRNEFDVESAPASRNHSREDPWN
ncbi:hypothetical protein CBS63078_6367 [Aspergillus niger]|uniref:Rhodopsin domain-containing protein n=2 Tax=Aspergillus TaxID=5052 RepID=A0A370PTI6_ASPPH|nr:hypothetical protein CBS133816_4682 [Aspergillus niger]RDK45507.1 hypothetical protein M752DRAFT_273775 [Aspergillus phoenicis ATCC 13157]KAI2882717.1 hypothetical protein CBS11852_9591 [Aspergillus niger]KAI2893482.1 hypothetical protein CBS13152_4471 [Aspergillus niger]KAI2902035.1 hypothetical protein CBS63078_6367 [Aspergillus niger]